MKQLVIAIIVALSTVASAQDRPAGRGGRAANEAGGVSPSEVQRMFDGYALMQAQDQLKIDDAHFSQFLTRYKALQEARRKALQDRARLVAELRRLLAAGQPDDTQLRDRMKELQDAETRAATDVRKASDAIDEVLSVAQQAKFRVFEEQMERRKLELVTRARQANRARNQ